MGVDATKGSVASTKNRDHWMDLFAFGSTVVKKLFSKISLPPSHFKLIQVSLFVTQVMGAAGAHIHMDLKQNVHCIFKSM